MYQGKKSRKYLWIELIIKITGNTIKYQESDTIFNVRCVYT